MIRISLRQQSQLAEIIEEELLFFLTRMLNAECHAENWRQSKVSLSTMNSTETIHLYIVKLEMLFHLYSDTLLQKNLINMVVKNSYAP